eukprot:68918-Prorocentrum_minimum.AAC.1
MARSKRPACAHALTTEPNVYTSAASPSCFICGPGGGKEGIYRSSLDARKPQNPINSEEYQGHLQ